eukprot:Em0016g264a
MLVGEKSDLQVQISRLQSQLKNKTQEAMDLEASLQTTKRRLEEALREKLSLNSTLSRREEALSLSSGHHGSLEQALQQARSLLEDQRQENAELISKMAAQGTELRRLQTSNAELQSRLAMSELLVQQLSAGEHSSHAATPPHQERLLQREMEALRSSVYKLTSERDQAVMDTTALRDTLTVQQQNHATNLAELQGQLADSHAQASVLIEKLGAFEQERGCTGNRKKATQELEAKLERLQEQVVDQKGLLTTISQDKETISRAMAQNKELKNHLAELQEAFVKQSHQSMELASELETAKRRWSQLEGQLELGTQQRAHLENELESVKKQRSQLEEERALERQQRSLLEGELGSETKSQAPLQYEDLEAERSHRVQLEQQLEMARLREAQLKKHLAELEGSAEHHLVHKSGDKEQMDGRGFSVETARVSHEEDVMRRELEQLQVRYEDLAGEHQRVLDQLHRYEQPSECSEAAEDTRLDLHNMTSEQLDTFSNSYSALQRKFLALMAEKAELLEQLQAKDHVVMQLSGETETIGEYISLYQLQRQALKSKFMENDRFVQQVTAEKASMQAKLQELQGLVKQLLAERATNPSLSTGRQVAAVGTPDLNRSLPTHLRHQQFHSTAPNNVSTQSLQGSPLDVPTIPPTAIQIMNLIKELETNHGPVTKDGVLLCPCCKGEVLVV